MSLKEITERIQDKTKRMGYCYEYLGAQVNKTGDTVRRLALHQDGTLYTLLDILDELKLELRLNDEVIQSHQDILDYINKYKIIPEKVAKNRNIPLKAVKMFCKGENINAGRVMTILEHVGIEARVI